MVRVISIHLNAGEAQPAVNKTFLGEELELVRLDAGNNPDRVKDLITQYAPGADAIALEGFRDHRSPDNISKFDNSHPYIPITHGLRLRDILQEWAIRHTQHSLKGFFSNCNALIFSGTGHYKSARVLTEFSENLRFADPILELGIPKFLTSFSALELFAQGTHQLFRWSPPAILSEGVSPVKEWNHFILRKAMHKADVLVAYFEQVARFGLEELAGKTLITSGVTSQQLETLKDNGVNMVIDYSAQPFNDCTLGIATLEAMIMAVLGKNSQLLTDDDLLEIITGLELEPRILYPCGFHRKSRFAFVIHPLSQQYFRNAKPLDLVAKVSPPLVMNTLERIIAYSPPFVYSRVTGIESPNGAQAEGWLITVGGTPKEIMAHSPEFTYRRLLAAAEMAKKLGAQIMGLGAFTKVVGDAGVTVAKRAPLPITTGNSYSASGALWAAHDAVQKMGLVKIGESGKMAGKAMVVGATGSIGSVCARLLAKAAEEIYLVAPEPAKLLALREDIEEETPGAVVHLMAHTDKHLGEMDMIVTATSGAGKKILDIMKVKPGCVITDVARPLDIPAEDVAKRPDVLVIESGEIRLPGHVQMKDIGLPENVVYACLAETIVLTLEGRFENFTLGRNIEWEKVREIYKLGLKHGMQLASISGVNGVYSDEDLAKIKQLALEKRAQTA